MNTATPAKSKGERLALLYPALGKAPAASTAGEAWQIVSDALVQIELEHAPTGEKKMVIPQWNHWMNQEYGPGGIYIPLIAHHLRINANGAMGIYSPHSETYEFQKSGADGVAFHEPVGWAYDYTVKRADVEAKASLEERSVEVAGVVHLDPTSADVHAGGVEASVDQTVQSYSREPFFFLRRLILAIVALVLFFAVQGYGKSLVPVEGQPYLWVFGQHGLAALVLGVMLLASVRATKSPISLWGSPSRKAVALGFAAVTASYAAITAYAIVSGAPQEPWMAKLLFGLNGTQTAILIASLLVFPPLSEELMFRYHLMELLPHRRSKFWAIGAVLVTSLAFAAVHSIQYTGMPTLVLMFAVGVIFATARIVSRGLGLPVLLHSYAVVLGLISNRLIS